MPPRTDFLTKQRQQIEARLRELLDVKGTDRG